MLIAFDGTTLTPGRTGVGYYTEHLLHHLARTAANDEIIVVSNRAVDTTSPLPARVTTWSIGIALLLGIVVGITFGVYPAHRASRLDPIEALRQE